MTDLTVLVSPIPLYPDTGNFSFGRRSTHPLARPIMVTLETEIDQEADREKPNVVSPVDEDFVEQPTSPPRRSRTPRIVDSNLLSPPINTWKARPRHRPTRSQSAPPERRAVFPAPEDEKTPESASFNQEQLGFVPRNPKRSFTSFTANRQTTQGGELVRPPPPLLRPTTFWRKTRRSGVTGASYSPASHLIRRSTYIAAGLTFDAPVHDLSALCVESRVGFIVIPPDQSLQ
ncbi:hypothetical protein GALMADRAFT_143905 [Galerina marginata CBS 339.88]|uniref:Uncharacterized protein n=1 Tax=Galerina marginata (strain CBS 339.88) TaxID=685588 RepID=A0A067SY16_GALM3|nr:hypothetical protein GALMADRAFT_143905 [Galerina marginata CBS 339.88]